ncbi:MAG TPA: hypothetical protein VE673_12930 [Pseudonocardiaceae bacterium]|nr:hypothetical protein [Pseudonocardiaceae bacterium]
MTNMHEAVRAEAGAVVNTAKQQCPTMAIDTPQHGCDASTAVDVRLAWTGFTASGPPGESAVRVGLTRDQPTPAARIIGAGAKRPA